jgi:hypothetical protein
MAKNEMKQQPIWMGAGVIFRTVRQIQQWEGRTVGIVRNGYGAEYVVQKAGGRWDALEGVSITDLREAAEASAPVATSAPVRTKRPRRADVIASEFREAENYWIELKPGFQNGADPGTHAIVEDTKTAARSRLSSVIPCDCAECVALAGKAVR